jgi:hypothetical protein
MVNNGENKLIYARFAIEDFLQKLNISLDQNISKKKLLTLKKQGRVKAISIDEMWTFVGKKENEVWIWSVVVEFKDGRVEKYLFVGDRSLETFLKDTGVFA